MAKIKKRKLHFHTCQNPACEHPNFESFQKNQRFCSVSCGAQVSANKRHAPPAVTWFPQAAQ
jgi:hypothetical protein